MLYGSLLAGIAFGNSGVGAAHALQFVVGAATHTSHGLGTACCSRTSWSTTVRPGPTRSRELSALMRAATP